MSAARLFYVYLGTKAQAVKMTPVIQEIVRRGWPVRIVDTGQHGKLTEEIIEDALVPSIRMALNSDSINSIDTLKGGIRWMAKLGTRYVLRSPVGPGRLFPDSNGVALVHGDTASTLLTVLIAKRAKQQVAHVEAGLRSWQLFNPFPEELFRVFVMRLSDHLFAPNRRAYKNLERMGLAERACRLPANTSLDAVRSSLARGRPILPPLPPSYAVVTIHRLETLYNRKRLITLVETIVEAARRVPIFFVQHPPTKRRLERYRLTAMLDQAEVQRIGLMDHVSFLHLIKNCEFLITDGGSVQEEAYYFGIPCLLYRDATERYEGIGENVVLAGRDNEDCIRSFVKGFHNYRRSSKLEMIESPSRVLVNELERLRGITVST